MFENFLKQTIDDCENERVKSYKDISNRTIIDSYHQSYTTSSFINSSNFANLNKVVETRMKGLNEENNRQIFLEKYFQSNYFLPSMKIHPENIVSPLYFDTTRYSFLFQFLTFFPHLIKRNLFNVYCEYIQIISWRNDCYTIFNFSRD